MNLRGIGARSRRSEEGAIAFMGLLLVPVFVALAGIVYDGGNALAVSRDATDVAEQAARAAANDLPASYLDDNGATGSLQYGSDAVSVGDAYIAQAEQSDAQLIGGSCVVQGVTAQTVACTATVWVRNQFLWTFNIPSFTITETGTAVIGQRYAPS
ncbi:MAG: pilus assembly protein TadG-related protein [Actinomycetota bacterium]|nr:pilus assembly protein TadG-related protein [Actinomycetota bacterium]